MTGLLIGGVSCSSNGGSDGSKATSKPDGTATTTTANDGSKLLSSGPLEAGKRYKYALSSKGLEEVSFVAPAGAEAVASAVDLGVNSSALGELRGLSVWQAGVTTRPAPDDPPGTASVPVSDGYLAWLVSLPQVEVISDQTEDIGGVQARAVVVGYKPGSPELNTTCGPKVDLAEAPDLIECLGPGERAFATFVGGRVLILVTYRADLPGAETTVDKLVGSLKVTIEP